MLNYKTEKCVEYLCQTKEQNQDKLLKHPQFPSLPKELQIFWCIRDTDIQKCNIIKLKIQRNHQDLNLIQLELSENIQPSLMPFNGDLLIYNDGT